ncbi:MAG: formylglycine-generating enzyme family protein [Minwuia sp.]|uniref:formylglycine-generating enzyme family protein n=1 Tax=Minwuia sp. TaxID=2493630 RepID=UPI003A84AA2E
MAIGHQCCEPIRSSSRLQGSAPAGAARSAAVGAVADGCHLNSRMLLIPGGRGLMGTTPDQGYASDGEVPEREVMLRPFWLDRCAVSNLDFLDFAEATGYRTTAEREGSSFVFAGLLQDLSLVTQAVADAPWWRLVEGADWRHPEGPRSTLDGREEHSVVHVSWDDARAYAAWAGKRLATEAEWEFAARGGLIGQPFPWGDELEPDGEHRMNVWQGDFPVEDTAADGYAGTAPVDAFPANGYGLHNMTGNVWEWCADWFALRHPDGPLIDPRGPDHGTRRVLKGGSFLCHSSYCMRYRTSARTGNEPTSSACHTGFRCARDFDPEEEDAPAGDPPGQPGRKP